MKIELMDRYPLLFRHRLHRVAELLGYLAQHHGGGIGLPGCCRMKVTNPPGGQRSDVPIQVQPVQAFYFQRDVIFQFNSSGMLGMTEILQIPAILCRSV